MAQVRQQRRTGRSLGNITWCVLSAICFFSCVLGVLADMAASASTHPTDIDFANPRSTLLFILVIVTYPVYIITTYLLWRRRKHYPIAGRGSLYLLLGNLNLLIWSIPIAVTGIMWPNGSPCSFLFFIAFLSTLPQALTYAVRGWILVFRLEMMNFLVETRWHEERRELRAKYANSVNNHDAALQSGNKKSDESVPASSIPGYFFIQHRNFIEAKFMLPFLGVVAFINVIVMILFGVLDPDVGLTDAYLRSRGMLPDGVSSGSQFSYDNILYAPPCLPYSTKLFAFMFLFTAILFPLICWILWKVIVDKQRREQRLKEREQLEIELFGAEEAEKRKLKAKDESKSNTHSGLELDDLHQVKIELGVALNVAVFGTIAWYLFQIWEPGYNAFIPLGGYAVLHLYTIMLPLRTSFVVSRQHRALIEGARSKEGGGAGKNQLLAHQKPYYTLKFILKNPNTYAVLLKFLQQEWSSENALFWTETREFERACKELESLIPTWPTGEKDEITTVGNVLNSDVIGSPSRMPTYSKRAQVVPALPEKGQNDVGVDTPPTLHKTLSSTLSTSPVTLRPVSLSKTNGNAPRSAPDTAANSSNSYDSLQRSTSAKDLLVRMQSNAASVAEVDMHALHMRAHFLKAWALRICENYLARSSMYEVNIAEDLSKMVQAQVKTLHQWDPTPLLEISTHYRRQPLSSGAPTIDEETEVETITIPNAAPKGGPPVVSSVMNQPNKTNNDSLSLHGNAPESASSPVAGGVFPTFPADSVKSPSTSSSSPSSVPASGWMPRANISNTELAIPDLVTVPHDFTGFPESPPFALSALYRPTNVAVFELIQKDSFRRFVLTPGFAQLLEKADEEELQRVENQQQLNDTTDIITQAAAKLQNPSTPSFKPMGLSRKSSVNPRVVDGGSMDFSSGSIELQNSPVPRRQMSVEYKMRTPIEPRVEEESLQPTPTDAAPFAHFAATFPASALSVAEHSPTLSHLQPTHPPSTALTPLSVQHPFAANA